MIIWRGWGWLAVGLPLLFFVVAAVTLAGYGFVGLGPAQATVYVDRLLAASFAGSALLLWPLVRRRNHTAPGIDHLAFIPMRYWLPIDLLVAAAFFVLSFYPTVNLFA